MLGGWLSDLEIPPDAKLVSICTGVDDSGAQTWTIQFRAPAPPTNPFDDLPASVGDSLPSSPSRAINAAAAARAAVQHPPLRGQSRVAVCNRRRHHYHHNKSPAAPQCPYRRRSRRSRRAAWHPPAQALARRPSQYPTRPHRRRPSPCCPPKRAPPTASSHCAVPS